MFTVFVVFFSHVLVALFNVFLLCYDVFLCFLFLCFNYDLMSTSYNNDLRDLESWNFFSKMVSSCILKCV